MGKRIGTGFRRVLLAGILAGALGGCVALTRNHGYIPPEADLAALTIGQDTRDSVVASVGAPGSSGLLDGSDFYYVQSSFRHYGAFAPEETDRQVLVMSFSDSGVLTNIEHFGLEGGQVVALSRRVTDDGLRDTTFLRQILGNLGNFDASRLIGED